MIYIAIWLYVWGVLMCGGSTKLVETMDGDENPSARWLGALLWPVIVPFGMMRAFYRKLAA